MNDAESHEPVQRSRRASEAFGESPARSVAAELLASAVLVACGIVFALHGWNASRGPSSERSSVRTTRSAHAVDFNDPTTLAWSLELPGSFEVDLHKVTCASAGGHGFACHGLLSDGREVTREVTVSSDGASWASS